jgi:hypothetical protein
MPEAETAKAVQLLDLMLDGRWARGRYDDGNGRDCLVGALLHLGCQHRLPRAPARGQDLAARPDREKTSRAGGRANRTAASGFDHQGARRSAGNGAAGAVSPVAASLRPCGVVDPLCKADLSSTRQMQVLPTHSCKLVKAHHVPLVDFWVRLAFDSSAERRTAFRIYQRLTRRADTRAGRILLKGVPWLPEL